MKLFLIAAFLVAAPIHAYAQTATGIDFDCSDYYGFNICAASPELADAQIINIEQSQNTITTKGEEPDSLFSNSATNKELDQAGKEDIFENSDSFRSYMKTLGGNVSTDTDSEFLVTTRIVDNPHFGLDCRVVTHSISALSDNNYYDCALQKYF